MANLNPADVKAGKAIPRPGDTVDGFAYVAGPPTSNDSYKPLQGQDYLSSIPRDRALQAGAVLAGKAPYPSMARNNKFNQQILMDVRSAEPDFDATKWKARVDLIKDFTSGPTSKMIQSLNQAPQHAMTLADAYDQLHNSDTYQGLNDLATNVEAGLAPVLPAGAFNASQPAVADELATLYKGGPGTVPGIEDQQKAFPMGAGPTESGSAMKTAAELMQDRMDTIQSKWDNVMGTAASLYPLVTDKPQQGFPVISPRAKAALQALHDRYKPPAPAAAAPAPAAADNGWTVKRR